MNPAHEADPYYADSHHWRNSLYTLDLWLLTSCVNRPFCTILVPILCASDRVVALIRRTNSGYLTAMIAQATAATDLRLRPPRYHDGSILSLGRCSPRFLFGHSAWPLVARLLVAETEQESPTAPLEDRSRPFDVAPPMPSVPRRHVVRIADESVVTLLFPARCRTNFPGCTSRS